MSSAKDLVQGSCGTSNPLMKATSHFASDQAYRSSNPGSKLKLMSYFETNIFHNF